MQTTSKIFVGVCICICLEVPVCAYVFTGSYGTLARYRSISRLNKVNDITLVGSSGDVADFQFVKSHLEQKVLV